MIKLYTCSGKLCQAIESEVIKVQQIARINELQALAKQYRAAARKLDEAAAVFRGAQTGETNGGVNGKAPRGTRLNELKEFIKKRGAMTRKEIVKESGMPKGTISTYLNDKHFKKEGKNKWIVK